MIHKNSIIFIALIIMVTGAVIAETIDTSVDVAVGDVVLMADDTPIQSITVDDDTDGKLYSLSRSNSDGVSDDGHVQFWVE